MNTRGILSICLFLMFSIPMPGSAWISGDESVRGPARAEIPHLATENNNEHGLLWRQTLEYSGLPNTLTGEFDLSYWTDSDGFPAELNQIDSTALRSYVLEGMSALPDHSYSLWDWAGGNLSCPFGTSSGSAEVCHEDVGHLGAVGSSHYPPQAQLTYAYYHNLALALAQQCGSLADLIENAAGDLDADVEADAFVRECEREALLMEAFGQHFLQDAWSSGHMWQRWGSSDIRSFPGGNQNLADAVALGAALIHGVEPLIEVQDDLSSGVATAEISVDGNLVSASGDLNLAELNNSADREQQRNRLHQCAAAGVRAVYSQTRMLSGTMDEYSGPGAPVSIDRLQSEDCFGQRVTDASMQNAVGISRDSAEREAQLIGASTLITNNGSELDELTDLFRLALLRLSASAWLSEQLDDDATGEATTYAEGGGYFSSFMGVESNQEYDDLAPYRDPELVAEDWPVSSGEATASRGNSFDTRPSRVLARAFNRAHFTGWCDDPEARPETLRDRFLNNPSSARRTICEEFTLRHVRPDGGESLCEVVGRGAYTLTAEAGQSASDAARLYCDPPPPPLEIVADLIEPDPRVARIRTDFDGGGGRTTENANNMPVDLAIDDTQDDLQLIAVLTSSNNIVNNGDSATITGTAAATLTQQALVLFPAESGEITGQIAWSVSITVDKTADYQLSVEFSGASTGLPSECVASIGVRLTGPGAGVLQEFYASACGGNYPSGVSQVVTGTLAAGTYQLLFTSDTPLDSDWSLVGSLLSPSVTLGSYFELRIVEEGEEF